MKPDPIFVLLLFFYENSFPLKTNNLSVSNGQLVVLTYYEKVYKYFIFPISLIFLNGSSLVN